MAYENMTYEFILNRMLTRVKQNYPNLDDREGSIIFNALAGASMELAMAYRELDNVLNESFVETASREYLLIACRQMGIPTEQFGASAGTFRGEFNVEIEIGSRWNCDMFNYEVVEYMGYDQLAEHYVYDMVCETLGSSPNNQRGILQPITYTPSGLTYAELTAVIIDGGDEKSDDEIRETYYRYVTGSANDGNVAQYKRWCDEYVGIGSYKIFPLFDNNPNSVKVSILNESNHKASDELVAEVQEYFDPLIEGQPTGMGNGVAPIGAFVTVSTATEVPINITCDVTMKDGYSSKDHIRQAVINYLSSIAYVKSSVAYMSLGAIILSVDGVDYIHNLLINGSTNDVELGDEEIPVIGSTYWGA